MNVLCSLICGADCTEQNLTIVNEFKSFFSYICLILSVISICIKTLSTIKQIRVIYQKISSSIVCDKKKDKAENVYTLRSSSVLHSGLLYFAMMAFDHHNQCLLTAIYKLFNIFWFYFKMFFIYIRGTKHEGFNTENLYSRFIGLIFYSIFQKNINHCVESEQYIYRLSHQF